MSMAAQGVEPWVRPTAHESHGVALLAELEAQRYSVTSSMPTSAAEPSGGVTAGALGMVRISLLRRKYVAAASEYSALSCGTLANA